MCASPAGPLTRAEATSYLETSRHADVMGFIAELQGRGDPRLAMMYPFVKTEKVGFLKCMCLLSNRRSCPAFVCHGLTRMPSGTVALLP